MGVIGFGGVVNPEHYSWVAVAVMVVAILHAAFQMLR
jgi:hypothetical protein